MPITNLDSLTPDNDANNISDGAGELRALQQELLDTFPGFTGELSAEVTPDKLLNLTKYVEVGTDKVTFYPSSTANKSYASVTLSNNGQVALQPSGLIVLPSGTILDKDAKPFANDSAQLSLESVATQALDGIDRDVVARGHSVDQRLDGLVLGSGSTASDINDLQVALDGMDDTLTAIEDARKSIVQQATNRYAIGDYFLTMDNSDPNTRFGGTWARAKDNVVLMSGTPKGTVTARPDTEVVGSNTVAYPLNEHTHRANFHGDQMPPHPHDVVAYPPSNGADLYAPLVGQSMTSLKKTTSGTPITVSDVTAGKPIAKATNVADTGVPDTTINVLGKHLPVYIWKRIA